MNRRILSLMSLGATGALMVTLLSGCAWSIGGESTAHGQPTRGQELIDLKKALDQGAITPEQYEAQKAKIMQK